MTDPNVTGPRETGLRAIGDDSLRTPPDPPSAAARRTLRLDLEFDGTDFLGWQRQREGRTVQAVVEEALLRVLGAPHRIVGSGRTDAGAHARHLVASFRTAHPMDAEALRRALEAVLPEDVGVLRVLEVDRRFHARRAARWKWYRYHVHRGRARRPLRRRTTWHVRGPLSREVLDAGAQALVGAHDFGAFANRGSPRRSTERTLFRAAWAEPEPDLLVFDVVGDGFLYKMVRTIVGTLVAWARPGGLDRIVPAPQPGTVDLEARTHDAVGRVLASRDRRVAGPAAPAKGLWLMAVGTSAWRCGAGGNGEGGHVDPGQWGALPEIPPRVVESTVLGTPGGQP